MLVDTHPVIKVDLKRYMGKWYEIARFDHYFERNLIEVTAEYKMDEKGKISVCNSGYKNTIKRRFVSKRGKIRVPNPDESGKLKVSFFLWFYSDYYILELDQSNYEYALLGSSKKDYLWILSRNINFSDEKKDFLLKKAKDRGYDISKFIWLYN